MFVPSIRKLTSVFAATLLVFASAVACSSEPPVDDPHSKYNADGSLKDDPFAFLGPNKEEETTADSSGSESRGRSGSGVRCLNIDGPGKMYDEAMDYPVRLDAPVWTVADIIEKAEEVKRVCGDRFFVEEAADYERWFCVGQEDGGWRLAFALEEFRYFDGSEFSSYRCADGQVIEPDFS